MTPNAELERLLLMGAEWLEARAAGRDTYRAERNYGAAMMVFRKAERRQRREEKRNR